MPLETPPLPRGDDETVADIGVALAELETVHRTGVYTTGTTEGFRNPYTPPPSPHASWRGVWSYSTIGPIRWAKLFRARFRRLFTVPRLQPVISAISW